jgi:hypothetical protein
MESKWRSNIAFKEVTWVAVIVVSDIQESVVDLTGTVWIYGFAP